ALGPRGIDGDERGRERALAQRVADGVRNAERGTECVGGDAVVAEVVREYALAHVAEHARQENPGSHLGRLAPPPAGRLRRRQVRFFLGSSNNRWTNWISSRIPVTDRVRSEISVSSASTRRSSSRTPPAPPSPLPSTRRPIQIGRGHG